MRSAAALLLLAFVVSPARADPFDDWCKAARLPSSIAICSDPQLGSLARERQQAYDEAKAKLDAAAQAALLRDQNAWVRAYPLACGLSESVPPELPLAPEIKACMARAGEARIAYLRAYGSSFAPPAQGAQPLLPAPTSPLLSEPSATASARIGPSFDCNKATEPLALTICASPRLSKIDLRFAQAYWALHEQIGAAADSQLMQEAIVFEHSVLRRCGVTAAGSSRCVARLYRRQRASWLAQLQGPAHEEAARPIRRHIALQRRLQDLGFLPAAARMDGVYGAATRAAILAWQGANGRRETGFLGDADAAALEHAAPQDLKKAFIAVTQSPPASEKSASASSGLPSPAAQARSGPPYPATPPARSSGQTWTIIRIGTNTVEYIDASRVKRVGNIATAYFLQNFPNQLPSGAILLPGGKTYLPPSGERLKFRSRKFKVEYNCDNDKWRPLYDEYFSGHMGAGNIVNGEGGSDIPGQWHKGNAQDQNREIACYGPASAQPAATTSPANLPPIGATAAAGPGVVRCLVEGKTFRVPMPRCDQLVHDWKLRHGVRPDEDGRDATACNLPFYGTIYTPGPECNKLISAAMHPAQPPPSGTDRLPSTFSRYVKLRGTRWWVEKTILAAECNSAFMGKINAIEGLKVQGIPRDHARNLLYPNQHSGIPAVKLNAYGGIREAKYVIYPSMAIRESVIDTIYDRPAEMPAMIARIRKDCVEAKLD